MIRRVSTYILSAVILVALGCASSAQTFDPPRKPRRCLDVSRAEKLAVAVNQEKTYLIHCSDADEQLLLANQGRIATLVYDKIRKTGSGEVLEVLSVAIDTH